MGDHPPAYGTETEKQGIPPQPAQYPQQPYPTHGAPPPGQPGMVPPPQYGSPHPQQPYSGTVIVQQPTTVTQVLQTRWGPSPMTMNCPSCQAHITTSTKKKLGTMVWLASGVICLVGCFILGILWLGCCLIPFCIPDLYDVEHICPNCNGSIGYYRRLS